MTKETEDTIQIKVKIPKDLLPQIREAAIKKHRSVPCIVSMLIKRAAKESIW